MSKGDYDLKHEFSPNPWVNLAYAVIMQAVEDYKTALARGEEGKIKELEHFFASSYFDVLGMDKVNGEYILRRLKEEQE